jgi:hypothetical protein
MDEIQALILWRHNLDFMRRTHRSFRRERKLLYTVAILAALGQGLALLRDFELSQLPSQSALVAELHSCQQQLGRCTASYMLRQLKRPADNGI